MLEPKDLDAIKEIVLPIVLASEERILDAVDTKVQHAKNEIITTLNREIIDLAEINRAVIAKVSVIPDLQHRLDIVERKLGIA